MDQIRKHSMIHMGGRNKSKDARSTERSSSKTAAQSPRLRPVPHSNSLAVVVESPPNIFYGNPQQSTGALFSGQLRLTITDPEITLDTFTMELVASIMTRKPVGQGCPECTTQITKLHSWTFIKEPKHLEHGEHLFPFSYLLPGHLPATTQGVLGTLEYSLQAKASSKNSATSNITVKYPLDIYRAVAPLGEKNSLRIFPPTTLTAHVTLAPIIHPIGEFPVFMRISGATDKQKDVQVRWRLRKMSWRLEETEKMISAACTKHSHKVGGEGKGMQHEDVRTLGYEERKDGWKTDWNAGTFEMEFSCRPSGSTRPLCDVDSPTGLHITHALVVELVIAEEWATLKRLDTATPTGAARVLRMQFALFVTERSGMGISWDEEQPPMYDDVPASPPMYAQGSSKAAAAAAMAAAAASTPPGGSANRGVSIVRTELFDYTGPPLDEPSIPPLEEMENMSLGDSLAGPSSNRNRDRSSSRVGRARARLSMDDLEVDEPNMSRLGRRRLRDVEEDEGAAPGEEDVGAGTVA